MSRTVENLICGDVIELAGRRGTFLGASPHPTYPHPIRLVVWRLDDGNLSFDALDYRQHVGELVSPLQGWKQRLELAMAADVHVAVAEYREQMTRTAQALEFIGSTDPRVLRLIDELKASGA